MRVLCLGVQTRPLCCHWHRMATAATGSAIATLRVHLQSECATAVLSVSQAKSAQLPGWEPEAGLPN